MNFKNIIAKFFNSKNTFVILLTLNVIVSIIIFRVASSIRFPDETGYWFMGESILNSKFSSWHFLNDYYPETLRTPGYPIFLAICQFIFKSPIFVKLVQLLIYFITILFCLDIIKRINKQISYRNTFLLILIPNIQIVYYSGCISSEILPVFFVILSIRLLFLKRTLYNALGMGVTSYLLFITKPSFLLLPFLIFLYILISEYKKTPISYSIVYIFSFIILLLPFAIWNKHNHNIFKVTSIEGGAGVAHIGYWQHKLPENYVEPYYWSNKIVPDLTEPEFCSSEEQNKNLKLFENEWKSILNKCSLHLSKKDSFNIKKMKENNPGMFLTYNSKYTLTREKELWKKTFDNVKKEPIFYIKTRFFHLFRVYTTGVNKNNWVIANNLLSKLKVVYPFFITFTFIFLGLLATTILTLFKKCQFNNKKILLLTVWYAGIIHTPFAIQARYSLPVHLIVLILLAIIFTKFTIKSTDE